MRLKGVTDYERALVTEDVLQARAARVERQDAIVIAARASIDFVEAAVSNGARSLVMACERAGRANLGPVGRDLVAVAHLVLEVDRALVRLAYERAEGARGQDRDRPRAAPREVNTLTGSNGGDPRRLVSDPP